MVLEGPGAIAICRSLMGPTFGPDAPGGTIRGDFALSRRYNLIHGSDSAEAAEREVALFFKPEEVFDVADAHAHVLRIRVVTVVIGIDDDLGATKRQARCIGDEAQHITTIDLV